MYQTLVLSSGGIKGLVILGYLYKNKELLKKINTFVGSSAGALICSLLSLDITPFDIILSFLLAKKPVIKLNNKILRLFFSEDMTLEELFQKTNKDLYITMYDLTNNKDVIYNYKTHPQKKIIEAVVESCNYSEWKNTYDGFLVSPFPISIALDISKNPILGVCVESNNEKDIFYLRVLSILCHKIIKFEKEKKRKEDLFVYIPIKFSSLVLDTTLANKIELFKLGYFFILE